MKKNSLSTYFVCANCKSNYPNKINKCSSCESTLFYKRKGKESQPIIAVCYDFDKTLSPNDMQTFGYIQKTGFSVEGFWKDCTLASFANNMDKNLAYMWMMISKSSGLFRPTKQLLMEEGAKVELFPGVETWFDRINKFGKKNGVLIEHYIISSGLKEMILGTSIQNEFEEIYASSFMFDQNDEPIWPAQCINFTNKTQFLYRITKGMLDINDEGVNDYFKNDEIRIPFRNMVYIGDSATDIPCMKVVNASGGHSIGVYNPLLENSKEKIKTLLQSQRIKYFCEANYQEGSDLEKLLKTIIEKTRFQELLEERSVKNQKE